MKEELQTKNWKEFFLTDIFNKIQRGKRLKQIDHVRGLKPYISSTSLNNGLNGFIGNEKSVRKFNNCLTIANSGSVASTFYHPYEFIASDHVTILENNDFSRFEYLFLSVISNRLKEKYSFNREINDNRIKREKILLPVNKKGEPNFEYMEAFMKQKEQEKLHEYDKYINQRIKELKDFKSVVPIEEKEFGEFVIGKLFNLSQGKSKGLNHLIKVNKGVNYLGATNLNNGVLCQVEKVEKLIHKGNAIAFIRNGEGSMGYSVYKKEEFIATSDISVGYNPNLNRHIGLFITTIADKVRGKYNFGYKRSGNRLKKEKILLPINDQNEPDYDYMENYMKQLEYNKLNEYLTKKEKLNTKA